MSLAGWFRPQPDGNVSVGIDDAGRELLQVLSRQLLDLLDQAESGSPSLSPVASDPSLVRLFPPAYPDDPTADADYRSLVGADLVISRRNALTALRDSARKTLLDEATLAAWLDALEALRLVLGTRLGIEDGDGDLDDLTPQGDDEDALATSVYHYLTAVQGALVELMASALPETDLDGP
jgi:hypothetical protein